MGKPILERLFEKKNRNKMTAAEKKAQERERKKEIGRASCRERV